MTLCDTTVTAAKKERQKKSDQNASVGRCGGPEAKRDCARRDGAEHGVSEAESAELAACASAAVESFEYE